MPGTQSTMSMELLQTCLTSCMLSLQVGALPVLPDLLLYACPPCGLTMSDQSLRFALVLAAHPELIDNPLYITGESYAGHYVGFVPALTDVWGLMGAPVNELASFSHRKRGGAISITK